MCDCECEPTIVKDLSHIGLIEDINSDLRVELYNFLDMLQDTGKTNMLGSPKYLVKHYNLNIKIANKVFTQWVDAQVKEMQLDQYINGE